MTFAPLGLALLFTAALAAFPLLMSVRQNTVVLWSFLGAGMALLLWSALLFGSALGKGRKLTLGIVPRKQHYVQACAQEIGRAHV